MSQSKEPTKAEIREMYLKVLNEATADRPPPDATMSDLERDVRQRVRLAVSGNDPREIEKILNIAFDEPPTVSEVAREYAENLSKPYIQP
jgi:flagellar motor component MotA